MLVEVFLLGFLGFLFGGGFSSSASSAAACSHSSLCVGALEFEYYDDLWFLLPMLVCVCVSTVESGILLSFYYLEDYGLMGLFIFFLFHSSNLMKKKK